MTELTQSTAVLLLRTVVLQQFIRFCAQKIRGGIPVVPSTLVQNSAEFAMLRKFRSAETLAPFNGWDKPL